MVRISDGLRLQSIKNWLLIDCEIRGGKSRFIISVNLWSAISHSMRCENAAWGYLKNSISAKLHPSYIPIKKGDITEVASTERICRLSVIWRPKDGRGMIDMKENNLNYFFRREVKNLKIVIHLNQRIRWSRKNIGVQVGDSLI